MIYVWRKGRCEHFMRSNILKFNWFLLSLWFLYFPPKNAPKNAELYDRSYFEIYFHFWIDACSYSSSSLFFCLFVCFYLHDIWLFPYMSSFSLSRRLVGYEISNFRNPLHYVRVYFYVAVVHSNRALIFFFKATIASIRSLIHRNDCEITKKNNNQTRQGCARFERNRYLLCVNAIFVELNFNFGFVAIAIANLFELISASFSQYTPHIDD